MAWPLLIKGSRVDTLNHFSSVVGLLWKSFEHRTAARDLYDISFLTRQYANHFSQASIRKLAELTADIDTVEQRFQEAFEEDEILDASRLMEIIFQVTEFVKQHPWK